MYEKKALDAAVGERIRAARVAAKLTQERFGELVDMSTKNVSSVERGAVGVSLTKLCRICQVLGVSADELLFGIHTSSDAQRLAARLQDLTPQQYAVACSMFDMLLRAFALPPE